MNIQDFLIAVDRVPLSITLIVFLALVFGWWLVYRTRYRNDPYFPAGKAEKVYVLLSERTPTGITLVDIVEGKWGVQGLYIPALDRIYRNVQFISGKKKLVHLTKGVDGKFKPAGLGLVDVGEVLTSVKGEDGAYHSKNEILKQVVKPTDLTEEEKKTLLVLLNPTLEEYLLTLDSFVDTVFTVAQEKVMKNVNPSYRGFFHKLFEGIEQDKLVLFALFIGLILLYLITTSSIEAIVRVAVETVKSVPKGGVV